MATHTSLTIRFPGDLLDGLRRTKTDGESVNGFVAAAVDREVRRRQALQAHARIVAIRQQIEEETGRQTGTAEVIREFRAGTGRRE